MSITSASAIVMLTVPGVFSSPVPLQQFAAEDIFTNDPVQASETAMGVDGFLAAGFVFAPVAWSVSLMADSPSNAFFDAWYAANKKAIDTFRCNGTVQLPALNQKWNMVNGALTTYRNMPDAAKTLRSRAFVITWQSVDPALIGA
jgi:hypothetical protein